MKWWKVTGSYASALIRAETLERAIELAHLKTPRHAEAAFDVDPKHSHEVEVPEGEGVVHMYVE